MFSRIVRSSKVQTAFLSLVSAVLLAASDGDLREDQVTHIIDLFVTYVVPTLLVTIGVEDAARKFGVTEAPKSEKEESEFQQL